MLIMEAPTIAFASAAEWEAWLADKQEQVEGLWLRIYKKDTAIATVTYAEALDVALCYGWIDGKKKSYDAYSWIQLFTPRRSKSGWSKVNQGHAARLIEAGRMQARGSREIEAAKADGRWAAAYDSAKTITVPEDLATELAIRPEAKAFFEGLNSSNRYAFLYRLQTAKKAETRARKLQEFVQMLSEGRKLLP